MVRKKSDRPNGYKIKNPTADLEYTDAELQRIEEVLFIYVANKYFGDGWMMSQHIVGLVQGLVELFNLNNSNPLDAAYIVRHIQHLKKIPHRHTKKEQVHAMLMLGLSKSKINSHNETINKYLEMEEIFKPPMDGFKDDMCRFTRWLILRSKETSHIVTNWKWANINIDYSIKTISRKKNN